MSLCVKRNPPTNIRNVCEPAVPPEKKEPTRCHAMFLVSKHHAKLIQKGKKGFELGPRINMQFNWSAYSGAWWYLSTSHRAQIRGIKVSGCWDPADSYRRMSGVGRLRPWGNDNNSQRLHVTNAAPLAAANLLACNLFCDKYLVIFALLYFYP